MKTNNANKLKIKITNNTIINLEMFTRVCIQSEMKKKRFDHIEYKKKKKHFQT